MLEEWMVRNTRFAKKRRRNFPIIVCTDGFELSVQASCRHACSPPNDHGPWTHVEIFSDEPIAGLEDYEEVVRDWDSGEEERTGVYHCVPLADVEMLIRDHGGMANVRETTALHS